MAKWSKFQNKKRPKNYEDPPEVLARQFFYLERWKAQGKNINQPRIAWSLGLARRWWENQFYNTREWGLMMMNFSQRSHGGTTSGRNQARDGRLKERFDRGRAKAHRNLRQRQALKTNPLAIPEQPKKVGRHLSL